MHISIGVPNPVMTASAIERRLLELAYTTDTKITATALAYFAPCSIDDAARVLDELAARDRIDMHVEDDGTVTYHLRGRQRIATPAPAPAPAPTEPPRLERALVPVRHRAVDASPLLAVALSALLPGAGHLYAGRAVAAVLWFFAVGLGYALILPGLVLHLFCMASAARSARRLEPPPPRFVLAPPAR